MAIRFLDQNFDYIHNNPLEAEKGDEPVQYRDSSARDYVGMKGLLKVELIEWDWV